MSLGIKVVQAGDVTILNASGRITHGEEMNALRDALRNTADEGQKKILLDLGEVSYIDSSGLGVLVSSYAHIQNAGGQLKLLHLTKRVQDLLVITKLHTIFDVYENEKSALGSFVSLAAGKPA